MNSMYPGQYIVAYNYTCKVLKLDEFQEKVLLLFPSGEKRWLDWDELEQD